MNQHSVMGSKNLPPVAIGGLTLAAGLGLLGWLDYRAVSHELRTLVDAQAAAVHGTVLAAARTQHAAAVQAEASLAERLLETARLLGALDRAGRLTPAVVAELSERNATYRVAVFAADGQREFEAGEPGSRGFGRGSGGGRGWSEGRGAAWGGPPSGAARLAQRLLSGEADEVVSAAHAARDGHQRVGAGIRRVGGGAILLNASSEAARQLDDVYSLGGLMAQVAAETPSLAYVILEADGRRVAEGPLASAVPETSDPGESRAYVTRSGVRLLEHRQRIALTGTDDGWLRIGMRLDDVEHGERRTLLRIAVSVSAALALVVVGISLAALRQRYGTLSQEHTRAQDALRRRSRLAAMGEMASTVAHEIRNPLNAIAMSAQRLGREYPLPEAAAEREEAADLLGVIQRESARINDTVEQFLEYARPRPLDRRAVALAGFVEDVGSAAAPLAATRNVRLERRCAPGLTGSIDPAQLAQALENLLRNAIDASPPGTTVTLTAYADGRDVVFDVIDQGAGIPPVVLPHIFDLYFTTRQEGTGVGLPVAQQIVTAHRGTIEVDTAPGRGTTMRVRVPAREEGRG